MHSTGPSRCEAAFTLVELITALSMAGLLILGLIPALAKTGPNGKATQCLENLRRLTGGWSMYAADFSERVSNNFGVSETLNGINTGRLENWANNVLTWSASSSVEDRSNTNIAWISKGVFGPYTSRAVHIYRCPADTYVSSAQRAAGWSRRVRSVSMNAVFGRFGGSVDPTANGLNWVLPQYVQFLKQTQVPKPAKTWVLVEEHPDSINDGYFVNNPTTSNWQDIPSSLHQGGCCFSFADGHVDIKRWQSPTSFYRVQFSYPYPRSFDAFGRADYAWYLARTGWVDAKTGQGAFGY